MLISDLTNVIDGEKTRKLRRASSALVLAACLGLSACMGGGSSAVSALGIDNTTTAAITPLSAESEILSDETLIRDLVGNLGEDELIGSQPWSNSLTGSAGVVSNFTTLTDGKKSCRLFQTTRHSFDGVGLLNGRVCRRPDGGWDLVSLDRTSG
ncbi:MAG: RT0821/Lpp0805 family surface protein [Hoeflea sp.]|uniref:RT0821/Lpp0805 family surface protein n=1 Tax=Hoeflea sp. TaxID=1940281 RepID=UPI003EF21B72